MTGHVKVGGAWKTVSAASVKVGGTWKTVSAAYTKIGGTWKQWYTSVAPSALTITQKTMPATNVWIGGVYFGGKIYAFGGATLSTSTTSYYYSSDEGTTWTTGTLPMSKPWGRAATNGSRIVVTSYTATSGIAYSDNGTTWTSVTTSFGNVRQIVYDDEIGAFLAVTSDSGTTGFVWSTNGTIWQNYDMGNGGNDIAKFNFAPPNDDKYFAVQPSLASSISITTTPTVGTVAWNTDSLPTSGNWMTVATGNGLVVAARAQTSTGGAIAKSTDGDQWTSVSPPRTIAASSGYTGMKIYFYNGYFYYIRGQSTVPQAIYRTTDWVTFETIEVGTGTGLMDGWVFITNGGSAYSFGADGSSANNEFLKIDGV